MQRAWLREFNSLGLQLRPQAAKVVTQFLQKCDDPSSTCELLVENTKAYIRSRQASATPLISAETIQSVINCMVEASEQAAANGDGDVAEAAEDAGRRSIEAFELGDGIQVYNVFTDVKNYDYRRATKEWVESPKRPTLFPGSDAKSKIYADRYHILLQRLLMEGKVVTEAEASVGAVLPDQRVLTPVESLAGNPGPKLTFGLVSRLLDDTTRRLVIEDLHRDFRVELEVEESEHLITAGSFVLAEGELVGEVFKISRMSVPDAVPRAVTREKDGIPLQVFGGRLTDEQIATLEGAEPANADGMYVVLCEVHLDSVSVLEKLCDLFRTYEQAGPPAVYIFMGSFCSTGFAPTAEGVRAYREGFERLKFLMRNLTAHVKRGSRFVFIPGPNDPGAQTLPQMPLASYMTSDIAKDIPGTIMATNPCRMRHFSRELVFFRHDVLRLLRRHELVPLREPGSGDIPSQQHVRYEMVRFLLDQAHLVPLPLEESNVLWAYDHTLRLYPLPHAVFIGAGSQQFQCSYQSCKFCSVGPFHRDASFFSYHPVMDVLEPCNVPEQVA